MISFIQADTLPTDLVWIDIVGLVLIGASLVLGFICGLWWQIIRLVGLMAAVLLARGLSPSLAPLLEEQIPSLGPRYASGTVWIIVFVLGLAAATLLGLLGRKLLKTMQLGLFDRIGGAVAGVITGAMIHIALVAAFCQLGPEPWVAEQLGETFSERMFKGAGTQWELVVGPDARKELDKLFKQTESLMDIPEKIKAKASEIPTPEVR
ncbi:MAG: putative membrane protein required for colicin V production [Planctomycetota bacterium]|jgi:uncharacterized membrane protein required for colicin V production